MKLLFHYSKLDLGGAEKSLLRMAKALVEDGHQVELVVSTGGGNLESSVDPRVTITRLRERVFGARFLQERRLLRKCLWLTLDLLPLLISRLQWLVRAISFRSREFDAAVISLQGLSPAFCCSWVRSRKRLQWIRNDLRHCDASGNARKYISRYHHKIDAFICVSETARQSLLSIFPSLTDKAFVMYNFLGADEMRTLGEAENPYLGLDNRTRVVTVCRIADQAKGLMRMLSVHRQLLDAGHDFYWFVVGDGPDRAMLEKTIAEQNMEEHFILLGPKANPFPYYRHADISATVSYYEGLCGAVNEAKVMGCAVVATRFSGIEEQIADGVNGLIVENNQEAIAAGLAKLLADTSFRKRLSNSILPKAIADDAAKLSEFKKILAK